LRNPVSCSVLNFVNKYLSDGELADLTNYYTPVIRDAGFDGMEVFIRTPGMPDIRRIKNTMVLYGMPVTSAHFPAGLFDESKSSCLKRVKELVDASLFLDCDLGIVHSPSLGTLAEEEKLKSLLYDLLPWTEARDFRLSIEISHIIGCRNYFKKIIEEFGQELIYLSLDMSILAAADFTVGRFYEETDLLPDNIYINDYSDSQGEGNGLRKLPALGKGSIDFVEAGFCLKHWGYEGIFTLKTPLGHLTDPILELVRCRNFIFNTLV
jgi:sugar phosphate isomerase/epimerase